MKMLVSHENISIGRQCCKGNLGEMAALSDACEMNECSCSALCLRLVLPPLAGLYDSVALVFLAVSADAADFCPFGPEEKFQVEGTEWHGPKSSVTQESEVKDLHDTCLKRSTRRCAVGTRQTMSFSVKLTSKSN